MYGSSPLTRGKQFGGHEGLRRAGLIPAHAGKTQDDAASVGESGAHPRSRGENDGSVSMSIEPSGSSPLTRGKPKLTAEDRQAARLIPAHAGKTHPMGRSEGASRAHPRSRGENAWRRRRGSRRAGSSPLTRGKPVTVDAGVSGVGLIPAHAGKTLRVILPPHVCRAHPRSRGENGEKWDTATPRGGSSPLTRGKQPRIALYNPLSGLIPAHAGKTPT